MFTLASACLTDKGRKRKENEDCVWAQLFTYQPRLSAGLFMVCDGMGGHMGGKFASYWAMETIKLEFGNLFHTKDPRSTVVLSEDDIEAVRKGTYILPPPFHPNLDELSESAIQKANTVVHGYARHKPKQAANAGTTITLMAVYGEEAVISNVGDSRAYLLHGDELLQITQDHSLVAHLLAEGQILPEEVYSHPQRNIIYQYLGQKDPVNIDQFHINLESEDKFLLCSDGLWEMVQSNEKITSLINTSPDPQSACQKLVEAANAAGGEDNISVIVVQVR